MHNAKSKIAVLVLAGAAALAGCKDNGTSIFNTGGEEKATVPQAETAPETWQENVTESPADNPGKADAPEAEATPELVPVPELAPETTYEDEATKTVEA